ncbi:cell cycle checkpoint protein RAD17 [Xylariomycetidae sp. FL2044]|nr:cell cycle checkpoint protein RAD17 [Xylariomycetidae sp. FL2044]
MVSILSYIPIVNRLVGSSSDDGKNRCIDIPPVEVHNVETAPEKRPRTLKHLLRANHVNHSIVYHHLQFDNHMPHILCSAYLLGADDKQLHKIYAAEAEELEPWEPSPAEVVQEDWRDFLGDKRYQRAYVDFFEDASAVKYRFDWKKVVDEYMFGGSRPLANGLIGGLGHPLIHLGYAYEMDNKEIAMEALGLAAVQYNFLHKYIDDSSYSKPSSFTSTSPLELLEKMSNDERLKDMFKQPGLDNLEPLFEKHEDLVLEYWNAWTLDDPVKQFQDSQEAAVALLVATVPPGTHAYNFFVVHLLTTSHAVRILLPFIPAKFHISLVREWWLLTIAVYISELCPKIDPDYIRPGDVAGKQWNYVEEKALNGSYATDAHFVKAIRAMKEAARTWGDVHEHYLAAAVRFVDDFEGWNPLIVPLFAMAPPAKRRRRNIVQDSDAEDEPKTQTNTLANYLFSSPDQKDSSTANAPRNSTPSPSPVRKSTRLAASQAARPTTKPAPPQLFSSSNTKTGSKSASTSPEKARGKLSARGKQIEKGKSADIVTLFSKQAERAPTRSPTKFDDIVSDPISDDDDVGEHRAAATSRIGQIARKRFRDPPTQAGNNAPAIVSSQRFLRPPRPPRDSSLDNDQRPWSERFGPQNLGELAVHKKKVADVRKWLEDVLAGRMRQRLLILKGAAGTGKTTTARLLAKDMCCELVEWKNPTGSLGATQEFMGRTGKFGQLDLGLEAPTLLKPDIDDNSKESRKIILIEEFPNTFARSSTALMSFRKTIMQYLATNTPSLTLFGRQTTNDPITPVIMVISETLLTTTSASADSFTAHRLLGPEITRHPGTRIIEFNAIAPTLLSSALEMIVQKEARKSGRRRTPGPLVLKRLGEIGDIRSAISSLEFLCLKGDNDADWGSRVAHTKMTRGAKNAIALTKSEAESLELVSQREASLGIFHAVGKVVYNKRSETSMSNETPEGRAEMLPDFVASYSRPKKSEISVDSLIDETGTDAHTFISALHENYALSCEPSSQSDPKSSLDYIADSVEYLSESDLLCPSRDIFFGGRGSTFAGRDSASHVLRQEEIAFQVATRGLLFSLPNPVKRLATATTASGGRPGSDAFKMFYPTSIKLWREKEELEGLVDHWSSTLLKGEDAGHQQLTDGASAFKKPKLAHSGSSAGEWISRHATNRPGSQQPSRTPDQAHETAAPLLSLGSSARREMLLERLPYMAHIARRQNRGAVGRIGGKTHAVRLKEIEKVVSFSGIGAAAASTDEENAAADGGDDDGLGDSGGAGGAADAWATDRPTEEASPRKRRLGIRHTNNYSGSSGGVGGIVAAAVQKMVLSDDDIEDD